MEAIIIFLVKVYLTTVGISAAVKIYKELRAKQIIEEKGYEIVKSDKEIQEEIADLYKEYSYILNPFKNLKKSWKLIWGSNKKYVASKIEKLQNDGKLRKKDKPEVIHIEEPKPEKHEVKKEEKKHEEKKPKVTHSLEENIELIVDEFRSQIESSNDIYFVAEIKKAYREKSKEERARYNELAAKFKKTSDKKEKAKIKTEVTSICRRVKAYDELYLCAKTRISELQKTASIIKK